MPPISARGYQFKDRSHFVRTLFLKCKKKLTSFFTGFLTKLIKSGIKDAHVH